jgi:hypothetical protein
MGTGLRHDHRQDADDHHHGDGYQQQCPRERQRRPGHLSRTYQVTEVTVDAV